VLEPALDTTGATNAADLRTAVASAAGLAFEGRGQERATPPARPRGRRRRWLFGIAALVLLVAAAAVAGIVVLGGQQPPRPAGPLAIGSDAALTVTPANGGCNTTFVFVGRGSVSGTGTLVYRWEQSDGQSSATTSLPITSDDGAFQLTQAWRLQGAQTLDASLTLHLLSPVNRTLKRPFHYACS
jgi:hypothetical protein